MMMKRRKRESGEDFDVDQEVLDRIINKLYDFGDGPDNKRSKKKHKRNLSKEKDDLTKLDCGKDDAGVSHVTTDTTAGDKGTPTTTAAVISGGPDRKASDVEIVTFQDPRKKKKLKRAAEAEIKPAEVKETKKKEPDVLSMEKARLDVHRFGITGFQKQQQRVFEQDRAIMLGAMPPRKEYVNYKVFQQMMKEKKTKEKQEVEAEAPIKQRKSSGKQKNVKRQSSAEPTGHAGRLKNGMLLLSSKDVQKLTSKVRK